MSAQASCPECEGQLPPGSPHGLCPKCLLRRALGEPSRADATAVDDVASSTPGVQAIGAAAYETVGQMIGRYKLLEQVGEGGCGVVYVAEQTEPIRRRVALKVIKAGMDTKQVVARFQAERQALALMDHPNIARVFDAGMTGAGRPYFVMELVRGVRITDYCDQNNLPTRERLDLFIKVCQAVQHAHQKGIIHRDIKPSNILVTVNDGAPVPKVIDFGIAKATEGRLADATVYTQLHQFIGTPAYMSPEQAEMTSLDIDTRSDIYSMGVLLYELLAGRPPFDVGEMMGAGLDAMRRTIREREPVRPSTRLATLKGDELTTTAKRRSTEAPRLLRQLRGDLDWIVMKCLEKDRTRRYETANGLAADLQRFLGDQPVTAGPPSTGYKIRKFVRRNRVQVITAGAILTALVAGMVGTTLGLFKARRQEQLASARLRQIEAEQKMTEEARRVAQVVRDFLQQKLLGQADVVAQANALMDAGHSATGAKENPTILELLNRAVVELAEDRIEMSFPNEPVLQAEILDTVGKTYVGIAQFERGIGLLRRAEALRKFHLGPDHPDTLRSMEHLAGAYHDAGKPELALPLFEETLKLRKARLGPGNRATVNSMNSLAVAYWQAKRLDKSIPLFEETRQLAEAAYGPGSMDSIMVAVSLGVNYQDAGRLSEALPLLEESLKLMKIRAGPDHPNTIGAMANLASVYLASGQADLGVPMAEETLKLTQSKFGSNHPTTLLAMGNLASAYQATGKMGLAVELSEETLKRRKEVLGPDHPRTLAAMNNLATAYWFVNELGKCIPLFEETIRRQEAKLGPDFPETLQTRHSLAQAYQTAGKLDLAVPLLEETLARMKASLGPDHPDTLITLGSLAGAYQNAGRLNLVLPLLEEALKITRNKFGPDDTNTFSAMFDLASASQAVGRTDQLVPILEDLLQRQRARLGSDHPDTLRTMRKLGPAYWRANRLDRSIPLIEETLQRTQAKRGRTHAETLMAMANLGVNYRDAGRFREAVSLLEEAYRETRNNPQRGWIGADLLDAYIKAGESAKALALQQETLAELRDALPEGSPQFADALARAAQVLLAQQQWAEAEPVIRECLTIRERALPDDWRTFNTKSMLGGALLGQKKYADAELLLLDGYRGMKQREASIPQEGRPRIVEVLERLVQLYAGNGNAAEAALWRRNLETARAAREKPATDGASR